VTDHVPWSCDGDADDCRRAWCEKHHGELFLCAVCNQAEVELETTCPGKPLIQVTDADVAAMGELLRRKPCLCPCHGDKEYFQCDGCFVATGDGSRKLSGVCELPLSCPKCETAFVCACGQPCMIVDRCSPKHCRQADEQAPICSECYAAKAVAE
jgi:hypothetical protein